MPETLLRTKLFAPRVRPNLVPRSHLIERLNQGLNLGHKLTLISAPAGFGKTTLVNIWVQQTEQPIAWLSLDENDNDPIRFLAYLVASLNHVEGIEATIGQGVLDMIHSPQPPPAESVLTSLINDVTAVSEGIIFILDDYHLVDSSPVDETLTFMLEHLPPRMHLVIVTREDPHLPLSRLRVRGQLTELRGADLRFVHSEAAEFLNQIMGLDLSEEDVRVLETRTEGWIAGLQLAAISMQGREDASGFIQAFTGSHRYVLDYLIDEVLEQQPEGVQTFLLKTAVLDRLTGPLCDALTGQDNGQATLEMLEHANMFIVPLDEERRWYRYHRFFSDLLRHRLRQSQPEELPNLNIRAVEWFSHRGLNREAIKHSLAARDYQGAARLIRSIAIDIMQQGEHTTVAGWINALPNEITIQRPYLCVLHAWALQLAGQLETADARLLEAENAIEDSKHLDDEDGDTILGLIHSRRAYLAFMIGEHDKTISYARQALDELPETAALIRAQTALYLGIAYRYHGQLRAALDIYNEILPVTRRMDGRSIAVLSFLHLGDLVREMGQLHQARELYEQALQFTERHTGRPDRPFSGYAYVSIGRILRQWNQLEKAYRFTSKGLTLCRDWNVADILALSCIEMAYVCRALGYDEQVRVALQEASQILDGVSSWGTKFGAAHQAQINLERGDIAAAESWAQAIDLVVDGDFDFHREIEYLTLARVHLAQMRFEEAKFLVERIYRIAQEIGKTRTELEALILLALASSMESETDLALIHLEKALSISEPEGFIRIFVDEGPPMAHLLHVALSRGIASDYVRRLLGAFPVDGPMGADLKRTEADQSELVDPLSDRELEVLQLIAEGLTNREIASRLYISLHTVKAHSRTIYGKLDVHNRTRAVTQARALGILPPL